MATGSGGERMRSDATYALQERLQMAPACWRPCPLCGVSSSGGVLIKSVSGASCQGSRAYSVETYGLVLNSRHLRLVSRGGGEMSQGRQVYMRVCCAKLKASSASLQVAVVFFGGSSVTPRRGSYQPGSAQEDHHSNDPLILLLWKYLSVCLAVCLEGIKSCFCKVC